MRKSAAIAMILAATALPVQAFALDASSHPMCRDLAKASEDAFNNRAGEWSDPTKGFYSNPSGLKDRTCFASIFSKDFDLLTFSLSSILDSIGNQICSAAYSMTSNVGSSLDCGLYGSGVGFGLGGLGFGGKLCQNINVGGFGGPPIGVGMRNDNSGNSVIPNFGGRSRSDGQGQGSGSNGTYSGGLFK